MRRAVVLAAVVVLVACSSSDEVEPVTKAELREWLEKGGDVTAGDPRCLLDPLWDAGLTDAELREFLDPVGGRIPSQIAVYTAIRDECNDSYIREACAAGILNPIECLNVEQSSASP